MLRRLTKRAEFLKAARGRKASGRGLTLQMAHAPAQNAGIGFTVTKRTGNAVVRNRIKRRLRAASTQCAPQFQSGHDYVLIGRREALTEPFTALVSGLDRLIAAVHAKSEPTKRTRLQADR